MVKVRDIAKAHYGKALKKEFRDESGSFEVFGSSGQVGVHSEALINYPTLIVGRKGSVGEVIWAPNGGWIIDTAYYLELLEKDTVDLRYLYYALKKANLSQRTITTSIPGLNRDDFYDSEIPLPPLAEQKRIAAILDKADAIRRKRQQAIQLADDFLRAVFLDMFGDPVTNPKRWEVKALKDISTIQIGPFGTQLHKEDYIEGGIPLVNPTHIVKGQIAPKSDLTISAEKHAELPEYHLMVGDIIMGRRGEMGRCAVVTEKESGWLCGTGSLFIRPNEVGIFSEYLNKFLSSEAIKSYLESESQGATMPNLNKTIVGNIQVPVPSELALKRFAVIKEKVLAAKAVSLKFSEETIFDSISQKAFRGEL
nr:restriction endonuclease subunit S [Thalassolituus pacificus]